MAELHLRASLCGDLVRVTVDDATGRVPQRGLVAIAARAALLLDLAAIGALERPEQTEGVALDAGPSQPAPLLVDTSSTGCRSADAMLGFIGRHPNHSIDHLLRLGRPHLSGVERELVSQGCWSGHHRLVGGGRFHDVAREQFLDLRRRIPLMLDGYVRPADEREAALAAIVDVLGICWRRDADEPTSDRMLAMLDTTAWLGRDVIDYLRVIRIRREMAASGGGGGDG